MAVIQYVGGGPVPIPSQVLGPRGPQGWTPTFEVVPDGAHRRVIAVDWQGGAEPKPATGFIGPAGLVAAAADATDVVGLKITSMVQQPNYDLLVTFHDGSTYTVPNFFADMVVMAQDVAAKYPDIVGRHDDLVIKHGEVISKAVEVEAKRAEVNGLVSQAANIVFNGSTDFPTIAPLFYWHCDMGEIDPRIDIAYSGNLSVFDHRGLLRSVPQAARVLDYNPVTRASLGMPLWETRTNRFPWSTNMSNISWAYSGAIRSTQVTAPSGRTGAVLLQENNASAFHYIGYQVPNATYTDNVNITISIIVEDSTKNRNFGIQARKKDGVYPKSIFDLSTLAITNASGGIGKITPLSGGRFLCEITYNTGAGAFNHEVFFMLHQGSNSSYTGDGVSGIFLYDPQHEEGAFATPYIPTTVDAASRGGITAQIQGLAFSQFYNPNEGTLVIRYIPAVITSSDQRIASLFPASGFGAVRFRVTNNSNNVVVGNDNSSGVYDAALSSAIDVAGAVHCIAVSMQTNNFRMSKNGGATVSDTSCQLATNFNRLEIGGTTFGSQINGWIQEISYYPKALPDAQLQALSRL